MSKDELVNGGHTPPYYLDEPTMDHVEGDAHAQAHERLDTLDLAKTSLELCP